MAAGTVIAIARCEVKRVPMELLDTAEISVEGGIEGDARGRKRDRQVTLLTREGWDAACADLGKDLDWTTRRANILVEGIDLAHTKHQRLRIGPVVFDIAMQTQPCFLMNQFEQGLKEALRPDWRGGVCCRVVEGGRIGLGDTVELVS